jgi:hypothetical protein
MERKKSTAILLAVFFSFWAWLYTYKQDAWKFWVCLGINCFFLAPVIFFWNLDVQGEAGEGRIYALIGAILIFIPVWLTSWVLAIIDASLKSPQRYQNLDTKRRL